MADDALLFEKLGAVARLTLNRPHAMNALNGALVAALDRAMDDVLRDPETRVVLLTGSGSAFCAGADLKEATGTDTPPGEPDFLSRAGDMMKRLSALPKPVIVALNGVTMAGGLELAMAGDIIIAADTAKIGDAHANFGVFPGAGGAAILPRLIPLPTALYLLYTGRTLSAARMYELGLVAEVHPAERLETASLDLAAGIAKKSPAVLRKMKAVARASSDKTREDALFHEQVMLREHLRSADMQEGLRAFAEKREPNFTGK